MFITNGNVTGYYKNLFPNTSFPVSGPSETWLKLQGFTKVEKTEDELANEVRAKRNRLISETDWMALSDTTMSPEWASYRQALRDITSQETFPYNVEWPVKPE